MAPCLSKLETSNYNPHLLQSGMTIFDLQFKFWVLGYRMGWECLPKFLSMFCKLFWPWVLGRAAQTQQSLQKLFWIKNILFCCWLAQWRHTLSLSISSVNLVRIGLLHVYSIPHYQLFSKNIGQEGGWRVVMILSLLVKEVVPCRGSWGDFL
jgi:hypothetical protein